MSSYEVEHNVPQDQQPTQPRRRPDLSTFFSQLDQIDTTGSRQPQNANSVPLPSDVSATLRELANAFAVMRGDSPDPSQGDNNDRLLDRLIDELREAAEHPPTEIQGVSDEFVSSLERIPKKSLKKDMDCAICREEFLDDQYPLVVRLPCFREHVYDLECIEPWLKTQGCCPLCRKDFRKKKEPPVAKREEEEEEEEYDDMYA
ncbi:hypothetical protein DOTSEDRAFT_20643 [Dothistroma septosporum NZE10]|uniref:RING-type domain-containing protein n=1 Tax=Dothistroma septosporum (strain NZE10 / CBS 128990) TaxID=675120 RepID=N1Q592_DOTSN|nr:hypothetical protein DOTSEDRAFT_20643 [Dothistroma septosporum NZE10]